MEKPEEVYDGLVKELMNTTEEYDRLIIMSRMDSVLSLMEMNE